LRVGRERCGLRIDLHDGCATAQCLDRQRSSGIDHRGRADAEKHIARHAPMMHALIEGSQARSCLTDLPSGMGVERHAPVFQIGVEGAPPSCPSIFSSGRDALPRVLNFGLRSNAALPSVFRDAKSRCQSELHRSGRGGSTPPSRRGPCGRPQPRVANFDSEVPALNRRELGANPRQPTI